MKDYLATIGSWIIALLCIALLYVTVGRKNEASVRREQEITSLKRQLADTKQELADAQSPLSSSKVGSRIMEQMLTVQDWRKGNPNAKPFRDILRESTDSRIQTLLAESDTYIADLNETELQVLEAGTNLKIQEAFEALRQEFTGEDLERFEEMIQSPENMEILRSMVEPVVAKGMKLREKVENE